MKKKKEAPATASKKIKTNDALEDDVPNVPNEDCNTSKTIDANAIKKPTEDVPPTSGSKSSSTSSSIQKTTSSFWKDFIDLTEKDGANNISFPKRSKLSLSGRKKKGSVLPLAISKNKTNDDEASGENVDESLGHSPSEENYFVRSTSETKRTDSASSNYQTISSTSDNPNTSTVEREVTNNYAEGENNNTSTIENLSEIEDPKAVEKSITNETPLMPAEKKKA